MKTFAQLDIGDDFIAPTNEELIYTKIAENKFEIYYDFNKKVERVVFTADPNEEVVWVFVE